MLPDKGLYLDSNELRQPKGTWRDARNILRGRKKGSFTSDLGTVATATGYPLQLLNLLELQYFRMVLM